MHVRSFTYFFVKKSFFISALIAYLAVAVALTPHTAHAAPKIKKLGKPKVVFQQPKITKLQFTVESEETDTVTDSIAWPQEADTLVELPSDAKSVKLSAVATTNKTGPLKWAFVPVWNNTAPTAKSLVSDALQLAQKKLSAGKFISKSQSEQIKIASGGAKYVTVYAFVKNEDKITAAPKFPYGIDYAAAATFYLGEDEVVTAEDDAPSDQQKTDAPKPQMGTLSVVKHVTSPSGAASKGMDMTAAKFQVTSNIASYAHAVSLGIDTNLKANKSRLIKIYRSQIMTNTNLLGTATLADVANGSVTIKFKEPEPVLSSNTDPLILTISVDTVDADQNSWLQVNLLGVSKSVGADQEYQALNAAGNKLVMGGGTSSPQDSTDAAAAIQPVTFATAVNSPSGVSSKSTGQTVAKFVLNNPASQPMLAGINGITVAFNTNLKPTASRMYAIYKGEQTASSALIAQGSLETIVSSGSGGTYVAFEKPLSIEGGTNQIITITADTVDASASTELQVKIIGHKQTVDGTASSFTNGASGKMLVY